MDFLKVYRRDIFSDIYQNETKQLEINNTKQIF